MEVNKVENKFSDFEVTKPKEQNWKEIAIASFCVLVVLLFINLNISINDVNARTINIQSHVLMIDEHIEKLNSSSSCGVKNVTVTLPTPTIDLSDAHKLGTGKISMVIFSDYQCPFCERGYQTEKLIKEKYGSDLTIYFKDFPLTNIHQYAEKAAEGAECASDQGKFWEYHNKLFDNQRALNVTYLKQYAKDLNLDTTKFNTCLDSGSKANKVKNDQDEGIKFGVQGTPTYIINGEQIVGAQPFEVFESSIIAKR